MNTSIRLNGNIIATIAAAVVITAGVANARPLPERDCFATELAAVVAASSRHNPVSIREDREFMGAILRKGDCYAYTVGAGKRRRDVITVKIALDTDADVVAFWHTHGARRSTNRYFSDVDTRLVEQWQKPLYLADYTGALRIMQPGARRISSMRARELGLPKRSGYASGRVVTDASGNPAKIRVN